MAKQIARRKGESKGLIFSRALRNQPYRYLVGAVFAFNFFRILNLRFYTQEGDAAGFVDVLSNPGHSPYLHFGEMDSLLNIHKLIVLGSKFTCDSNIFAGLIHNDFFVYHPYLIGYLTRNFAFLFPNPVALPLILLALSVTFGLLTIYSYLNELKVNIYLRFGFLTIVLINPIFFRGYSWQPYINRLFFGPAIWITLRLLNRKKISRIDHLKLITLIFICLSLSERSSLYTGMAIICALICRKRDDISTIARYFYLIISLICLSWYYIWTHFFTINLDYSNGNFNFHTLFNNLVSAMNGERYPSLTILLLALMPFLLISCIDFKIFAVELFLILPLLIVSNSTSVLNSFYAHYQSDFFPIFLAFSAFALTKIKSLHFQRTTSLVVACMFLLSLIFYIDQDEKVGDIFTKSSHYLQEFAYSLGFTYLPVGTAQEHEFLDNLTKTNSSLRKIVEEIPTLGKSDFVSAPEGLMPSLVAAGKIHIDYFPIGVNKDKYLLVPSVGLGSIPDVSIYGTVPKSDQVQWSSCIKTQIAQNYTSVDSWIVSGARITLYKKID